MSWWRFWENIHVIKTYWTRSSHWIFSHLDRPVTVLVGGVPNHMSFMIWDPKGFHKVLGNKQLEGEEHSTFSWFFSILFSPSCHTKYFHSNERRNMVMIKLAWIQAVRHTCLPTCWYLLTCSILFNVWGYPAQESEVTQSTSHLRHFYTDKKCTASSAYHHFPSRYPASLHAKKDVIVAFSTSCLDGAGWREREREREIFSAISPKNQSLIFHLPKKPQNPSKTRRQTIFLPSKPGHRVACLPLAPTRGICRNHPMCTCWPPNACCRCRSLQASLRPYGRRGGAWVVGKGWIRGGFVVDSFRWNPPTEWIHIPTKREVWKLIDSKMPFFWGIC